jgi:hypothetical protein
MSISTTRVDLNSHGVWEAAPPGERERATCETLGDGQRVACCYAVRERSYEHVVCDGYHRVLHRQLIACGGAPPVPVKGSRS